MVEAQNRPASAAQSIVFFSVLETVAERLPQFLLTDNTLTESVLI